MGPVSPLSAHSFLPLPGPAPCCQIRQEALCAGPQHPRLLTPLGPENIPAHSFVPCSQSQWRGTVRVCVVQSHSVLRAAAGGAHILPKLAPHRVSKSKRRVVRGAGIHWAPPTPQTPSRALEGKKRSKTPQPPFKSSTPRILRIVGLPPCQAI